MTLNMAAAAPIPRATVAVAARAKTGPLRRRRIASERSLTKSANMRVQRMSLSSLNLAARTLLLAQRLCWIDAGGAPGGEITGDQSDNGQHCEHAQIGRLVGGGDSEQHAAQRSPDGQADSQSDNQPDARHPHALL